MAQNKKRLFVILAVLVLFILISWTTGKWIMYFLTSIAISFLLISLIFPYLTLKGIRIQRDMPEEAHEDDNLKINIRIKNQTKLAKWNLKIEDIVTFAPPERRNLILIIEKLDPGEERVFSIEISCYKRGRYKIGPFTVINSLPFGIFTIKKEIHQYSDLVVFPQLFDVTNFPPVLGKGLTSWFGTHSSRKTGDSQDFFGVREYRPGDSLRIIHWLSTARLGELITKQFERSDIGEATIAIDSYRQHSIGIGKENTFEYAVKIAASVGKYLISRGTLVQLIAGHKESDIVAFSKGKSHFLHILEFLTSVEAAGEVKLGQILDQRESIIPKQSTLIVILLDIDQNSLKFLLQFRMKNIALVLFILNSSSFGYLESFYKPSEIYSFTNRVTPYVYSISKGDNIEFKLKEARQWFPLEIQV